MKKITKICYCLDSSIENGMFCIDMESMSEQNRALMIASSPRGGDEISTDGKNLIISAQTIKNGEKDILKSLEKINKRYSTALKKLGEFPFNSKEGWGLTNNGKLLIMSDGTSKIHFIDPISNKEVKTIEVVDNNGAIDNINELEYVDGVLYSNIWMKNTTPPSSIRPWLLENHGNSTFTAAARSKPPFWRIESGT